jgi:pimeloyl-ACP methyl ester carboxylesterase
MTHVELPAADRITPIDANARIITETAAGLPIVEYQHISMAARSTRLPTVLCMAGGGFSGAVYALLAEICAARGIRVVGFDMPGHTPVGLLGSATPSRALISRANTRVRAAAVNTMVARWRPRSARLDVLGTLRDSQTLRGWTLRSPYGAGVS